MKYLVLVSLHKALLENSIPRDLVNPPTGGLSVAVKKSLSPYFSP